MKLELLPSKLKTPDTGDQLVSQGQKRWRSLRPRRLSSQKMLILTLQYGAMLLLTFIYLFPLIYLINVSLKTPADFYNDPIGMTRTFSIGNYIDAWNQGSFGDYIFNSFLYSVGATVPSLVLTLLMAFPIARGYIKGSRFWYALFVVALFLPGSLIPQFQLIFHLGLYNTQIGYMLLHVGAGPFLVIAYMKHIPRELDEAAAIDGCGYFRYVFTIVAPLAKPILVTVAIFQLIGIWNDLIGPTIYLSDQSYYPMTLGLFTFFGNFGNQWTILAAATLIVAAPLVVIYLVLQRYFIEGAMAGAIK